MLALVNGNVFQPGGDFQRGDILIENGTIKEVRPSATIGPDAAVLDLAGRSVIPGLINLHSHITFFKGAAEANDHVVALKAAANAKRALRAGITTVRDVGGVRHCDIRLRDAIESDLLPGPRLLVSGMFICMTGGHSHHYAREADGAEAIRTAVREQAKAGADLIKFMGSGGVADAGEKPDQVQFTFDELKVGIEEAHRLGRKAAVHAHPAMAIRNAVLAGADFVEHATYLDDAIIDLLLEHEVTIVPTLSVYQRISVDPTRPSVLRDNARRILDEKLEGFSVAARAGVRWGVGLDNGTFYPPDDIAAELELLVEAGVSVADTLLAATSGNAGHLGLQDKVGSLVGGRAADIVVLDQDPTADIGRVRAPWLVIKGGRVFPRDPLFQASPPKERIVV